jgi:hypothetical protein
LAGEIETLEYQLAEEEGDLLDTLKKLSREDAPKTRFSIVTGELRMIEKIRSRIEIIKNARNPKAKGTTGA